MLLQNSCKNYKFANQEIFEAFLKATVTTNMATQAYNAVSWHVEEVGARVVAKTGIPSDRHHVGKLILQSLQEDPDFILQIDAATGESETFGSVLDRSIRCAVAFTKMGLKKDDVIVLMGPNHLDYCIPHHAALYLGIMVASVDVTLGANELKDFFLKNRPNIIFGQSEKMKDIERALALSELDAKVVTFDKDESHTSLAQLLEVKDGEAIKNFKATDFDPKDTVGYLTSTSGTTGVPKTAMLTHKNLSIGMPYIYLFSNFPTPTKLAFMPSSAQWLTAGIHYVFSSILKYTRLQISASLTPEHFSELVNAYRLDAQTVPQNFFETVITKHPGVLHAAVAGIPDKECGDLVVACVVPKPGCSPTAQEIKDLVKESLTDSKQLRGGVIFLEELPTTSTSKINRQKLKELVLSLPRQ